MASKLGSAGGALFLLTVGLFGACGKPNSAHGPTVADGGVKVSGTPIAATDLCPGMVGGFCHYLMNCAGEHYQSLDQCTAESDCQGVGELVAAVQSGAVAYDASKAGQCYAAFMSDPCHFGFFWGYPTIFDVFAFCPGTVTPKQKAGQPCVDSHECTSGLYCLKTAFGVCPGTCTAKAQQGESCASGQLCADGLYCQGTLCQSPAKAGDSCEDLAGCNWGSLECKDGQICDGNIWCDLSVKQCKAGVHEGGTCGTVLGTGTGTSYFPTCAINLWCDSTSALVTGVCRNKSASGGPCIASGGCQDGLHCDGYVSSGSSASYGTCVGPAAAGSNCDEDSDCQTGLACRTQKCGPLGSAGATCSEDAECAADLFCNQSLCTTAHYPGSSCNDTDAFCAYGRCVAGTCTRFKVVGESCASSDECASSLCLATTGRCYDDSLCSP